MTAAEKRTAYWAWAFVAPTIIGLIVLNFYPAINELECYRDNPGAPTPVAHDVSLHILTLPIYEGRKEHESKIRDYISHIKRHSGQGNPVGSSWGRSDHGGNVGNSVEE